MDYKQILDALPELIYVTDSNGLATDFYNKTWYEYTGFTEEKAMRGWNEVVDPRDIERITEIIQNAVENKESYAVEVRLLRHGTGEFRWFLAKANPILDENGELESYVGISTDIDDIKNSILNSNLMYEARLEERLAKIEQLQKELNIHNSNK